MPSPYKYSQWTRTKSPSDSMLSILSLWPCLKSKVFHSTAPLLMRDTSELSHLETSLWVLLNSFTLHRQRNWCQRRDDWDPGWYYLGPAATNGSNNAISLIVRDRTGVPYPPPSQWLSWPLHSSDFDFDFASVVLALALPSGMDFASAMISQFCLPLCIHWSLSHSCIVPSYTFQVSFSFFIIY